MLSHSRQSAGGGARGATARGRGRRDGRGRQGGPCVTSGSEVVRGRVVSLLCISAAIRARDDGRLVRYLLQAEPSVGLGIRRALGLTIEEPTIFQL